MSDMTDNANAEQNLAVAIESLLENMQAKFAALSDNLLNKIDEMSDRIDALETTLNELVAQAEMDQDTSSRTN